MYFSGRPPGLPASWNRIYEFIGFQCDPGLRSSDPSWIIFYHKNLKHVTKNPIQKCPISLVKLPMSIASTCSIIAKVCCIWV